MQLFPTVPLAIVLGIFGLVFLGAYLEEHGLPRFLRRPRVKPTYVLPSTELVPSHFREANSCEWQGIRYQLWTRTWQDQPNPRVQGVARFSCYVTAHHGDTRWVLLHGEGEETPTRFLFELDEGLLYLVGEKKRIVCYEFGIWRHDRIMVLPLPVPILEVPVAA